MSYAQMDYEVAIERAGMLAGILSSKITAIEESENKGPNELEELEALREFRTDLIREMRSALSTDQKFIGKTLHIYTRLLRDFMESDKNK